MGPPQSLNKAETANTANVSEYSKASQDQAQIERLNTSRKLNNPLQGLTEEQLVLRANEFCEHNGIEGEENIRAFRHGAKLAGDTSRYRDLDGLTDHERFCLDQEVNDKWKSLPPKAWFVVFGACYI